MVLSVFIFLAGFFIGDAMAINRVNSGKIISLKAFSLTKDEIITKAEFNEIHDGMSYKDIVVIIGGEGEMLSEVGLPGEELYTVIYTYVGKGNKGANASFVFLNDVLTAKAQLGLK